MNHTVCTCGKTFENIKQLLEHAEDAHRIVIVGRPVVKVDNRAKYRPDLYGRAGYRWGGLDERSKQ